MADYGGFDVPSLSLGPGIVATMSPWTAQNLRTAPAPQLQQGTMFGPQDQMGGQGLGNFQLAQPMLKSGLDTKQGMSPMQKFGIAQGVGDAIGGIMGGNAAKGIGQLMQQFQGPMNATLAHAQQNAMAPSQDQISQYAQSAARNQGGMYGGFYPGLPGQDY